MAEEPCSATGGRRIRVEGSGWRFSLMTGLLCMDGLNLIGPLANRPHVSHWDNPYKVGTHEDFRLRHNTSCIVHALGRVQDGCFNEWSGKLTNTLYG